VKEVRANFVRDAMTTVGAPPVIETFGNGTIAIAATSVEDVSTASPVAVPQNGESATPAIARAASEPRHA
jgi:hypothetical protein